MTIDEKVDVTGMCCPMPLIKLSQTVGALTAGQTLRVLGDDPIFEQGIRDFCEINQHEVISVTPLTGRTIEIIIRVAHLE